MLRLAAAVLASAWLPAGCEKGWQERLKLPSLDTLGRGGPREAPLVWAAGDMVHLTDRTARLEDASLFDAKARAVSLSAAANETVSFQLVVEGGAAGVKGVRLLWTDLAGPNKATIPAGAVQPFRMLPIQVSRYPPWYLRLVESTPEPAGVYDPLVPIEPQAKEALDVPAKGRLAVWVDVAVPRGAPAGEYRGALRMTSDSYLDWTATVSVDVRGFVLPDARPVPAIGGFDHRELFGALLQRDGKPFDPAVLDRGNPMVRRGLVAMRELMQLAHGHRLDLFDSAIHPVLKRDPNGQVKLQWADYDAIVSPYLDGTAFEDRIGVAAWPVPFSRDWPDPEHYDGEGSEVYRRTVSALLGECQRHMAALGAGQRAFAWPLRDPSGGGSYAAHARLAALIRQADPNLPILCQLAPQPPPGATWRAPDGFRQMADIFAPPGDLLDPSLAAGSIRPEHPLAGVWLAAGSPPHVPSLGLIAKPSDVRAACWFAMKYQCTGLLLPNVLHWSGDPFAEMAGAETRLFYPGTIAGLETALPSVRLKRLRRGLQDLAYLWILQRRDRAGIARATMNSLVRYAGLEAAGDNYLDGRLDGWVADGAIWSLARRVLATEVEAAVNPEAAGKVHSLAHQLAWKEFEERTAVLEIEQVRSVVKPAAGAKSHPPEKLQVTVLLDIYNPYGREADVEARFASLPAGWEALSGPRIGKIPPGQRKVVALDAEGPGPLPTEASGRAVLPITLTSDVADDRQVSATVPFLMAGRANRPPKIDGSLSDWPMRPGNTARDFVLLGRRGRKDAGLAARQTMAFLLRDEENLYVAFRCEEPKPAAMVKRASNTVHYEQLLACGEDLVEVLLDPGAKAAGPADLYHLVVKPNGVLIAERGVSCEPPLGAAAAWMATAKVAVGEQPGAWTVELAIPLSAFGPHAREPFWRGNFMRFATQGAEASSWSAAQRFFYDPRNLGTIFLSAEERKAE